jgi:indolepyruvate ferredoxin oxidoreductase beta subunit
VVGVGGQGVILISNIIGKAALKAGLPVRGAETHGMAQRGGSVMNHIRLGCEFGPLVPAGVALVNTYPVLPTTVTMGKAKYPPLDEILAPLQKICRDVKTLDATKLAATAGNPQTMNVVMLGALSKYIPLKEETLIEALSESIKAKYLEVNRRAFELGKGEV